MLNIMKADIYRLFRGKTIYITFILFWIYALQMIYPNRATLEIISFTVPGLSLMDKANGLQGIFNMMANAEDIIIFMLPLIFVISSTDFSSGAIQNVLDCGVSRVKFYASKLLLGILLCFVMYISGIILVMIVATLLNGFGGSITAEYILYLMKIFIFQFTILVGVVSIGTALIMITKSGAALNAIYIVVFTFLPLRMLYDNTIAKYNILFNLKSLVIMDKLSTADITRSLFIGLICILVSTFPGIFIFKRSDVKR